MNVINVLFHFILLFRSFNESMYSLSNGTKKWRTKLSSAGLVYYHFGQRVVADVLGPEVNENTVNLIYDQVCMVVMATFLLQLRGLSSCHGNCLKW